MPSTSKKQHNLMAAVAKNPAFAKKAGIPQRVGADFLKADKGRKFAKGGDIESKKMMQKEVSFMKKKGAPKSMVKHEMAEMKGKGYAKGGGCELKGKRKAFAGGGTSMVAPAAKIPDTVNSKYVVKKDAGPTSTGTSPGSAPPIYSKPQMGVSPAPTAPARSMMTPSAPTRPMQQVPEQFKGMKSGSSAPVDPMRGMLKGLIPSPEQTKAGEMEQARKAKAGAGTPQMTREQLMKMANLRAPTPVKRAASGSYGMKKGGSVKTFAKGGGCEVKGKTKGKFI